MKIKIIKCDNDYWYKNMIGEIIEIEPFFGDGTPIFYQVKNNISKLLHECNCKLIRDKTTKEDNKILNHTDYEQFAKNIHKALTNTITDNHNELSQAIALLQSNGYTLTPPYIPPTDSEICERIKSMNEEVGYVADFSVVDNKYYIYFVDNKYDYGGSQTCKILNTPYTTQSIAKQIVAELNEKRFVRV